MKSRPTVATLCSLLAYIWLSPMYAGEASEAGRGGPEKADKARQRIRAAKQRLRNDIRRSRQELSKLNETIAEERVDLVRRIDALRKDIGDLKNQLSAQENSQEQQRAELTSTRRRTENRRKRVDFIVSLAREYRRGFAGDLSAAEKQHYADTLERVDDILASDSSLERVKAVPSLLQLCRQYAENSGDGRVIHGGQEVGIRGIRGLVRQLIKNKPRPVMLMTDEDSRAELVVDVIDECKVAGAKTADSAGS